MKKDKLSQLFVQHLIKNLPEKTYLYGENEFFITQDQKLYSYDFTDILTRHIIEFNGDFFHANIHQYDMNEIITFKKEHHRAGDIWLRDYRKIKIAIENGFSVMIVWESDYKANSSKVISACAKFLIS